MNCIIVDDDPNCIKALNGLILEYLPNVKVMGTAKNLKEAVTLINTHEPDAVFLDVEIQDESGFDLFKFIPSPEFEVIFTTAHEKYALKAIKSSCFDFLLKPIDIEELTSTIVKQEKEKYGVYRDENNKLHWVAAECTHLKCIVKWNNDEKSWDCPCHGSRFNFKGEVLNGPANNPLDYHEDEFPEFKD